MRREFSKAVMRAAWKRADGHCENCTAELFSGNVHYDHDTPDAMNGEPTLANCVALCIPCHKAKTTKIDVPMIARTKRKEARHIGAKVKSGRSFPCGKDTPYKRKIGGGVVPR